MRITVDYKNKNRNPETFEAKAISIEKKSVDIYLLESVTRPPDKHPVEAVSLSMNHVRELRITNKVGGV